MFCSAVKHSNHLAIRPSLNALVNDNYREELELYGNTRNRYHIYAMQSVTLQLALEISPSVSPSKSSFTIVT